MRVYPDQCSCNSNILHVIFVLQILTKIFQFLCFADRKEAALVSKTWLEASKHPILMRDVITVYSSNDGLHTRQFGWVSSCIRWDCASLSFSESLLNDLNFKDTCSKVTILSLTGSDIMAHSFFCLLIHCRKLRVLNLTGCNNLFIASQTLALEADQALAKPVFQNVRELYLNSVRHLTDIAFNSLLLCCSNLQTLSLSGNQIIFCSNDDFTKCISGNGAILTFRNVLMNLSLLASTITSLDFSRTQIDSKALDELASVRNLSLRELSLVNCRELSDAGMIQLCLKQKKLQCLDISGCLNIGDLTLLAMTEHLTNLRVLSTSKCNKISSYSVTKLYKMQQLCKLSLSGCYRFTSDELIAGIVGEFYLTKLVNLNISCCEIVDDNLIVSLCRKLSTLEYLDISSCYKVSDISIFFITGLLTRLKYLSIAWCKKVSDNGLTGTLVDSEKGALTSIFCRSEFRQIATIAWSKNESKDLNGERLVDFSFHAIAKLQLLETLNLQACSKISDKGVALVFQFKSLKVLNLSLCVDISDECLQKISCTLPSLEDFAVASNPFISDIGVGFVARNLKRLHNLDISNCDRVTNKVLELIKHNAKRLRVLNVSMCRRITHAAVMAFEDSLPQINVIEKLLVDDA